jgi:cob(I)alamin adenosyltransferase
VRRIQTFDAGDERLVNRSRHVGGLIEVSGTVDDLSSLVGVIADEVTDESGARRRACLKANFDRIEARMSCR